MSDQISCCITRRYVLCGVMGFLLLMVTSVTPAEKKALRVEEGVCSGYVFMVS